MKSSRERSSWKQRKTGSSRNVFRGLQKRRNCVKERDTNWPCERFVRLSQVQEPASGRFDVLEVKKYKKGVSACANE